MALSLMANDTEHLFRCWLVIRISYYICLFRSFAHFTFQDFFSIIVGLQESVNFCCTAKWPHHIYIWWKEYIYIPLLTLSAIMFHHKGLDAVPFANRMFTFYWSRVDLQCRDKFLLFSKVFQLSMDTHPFSIRFFPHVDYRRILGRVLCAFAHFKIGLFLYPLAYMFIPSLYISVSINIYL